MATTKDEIKVIHVYLHITIKQEWLDIDQQIFKRLFIRFKMCQFKLPKFIFFRSEASSSSDV